MLKKKIFVFLQSYIKLSTRIFHYIKSFTVIYDINMRFQHSKKNHVIYVDTYNKNPFKYIYTNIYIDYNDLIIT